MVRDWQKENGAGREGRTPQTEDGLTVSRRVCRRPIPVQFRAQLQFRVQLDAWILLPNLRWLVVRSTRQYCIRLSPELYSTCP